MSTATATLPRTAGNGAALVVVAANFVLGLLKKGMAAPRTKTASQGVAADKADTLNVWNLYRLGAGSDSVSPQAVAKLRELAAN